MNRFIEKIKKEIRLEQVAAVILVLVVLFLFWTHRHDFVTDGVISFNDNGENVTMMALEDGRIEQQFRCVEDVNSIDVLVSNSGKEAEIIQVTLVSGQGEMLEQTQVEVPVSGEEMETLNLPVHTEGMAEEPGEIQMMNLQIEKTAEKSNVVFYTQPKGMYGNVYFTVITGTDSQLRMEISFDLEKNYTFYYILAAILLVVAIGAIFWKKEIKVQNLFLILVLLSGMTLAMINPICQECDGNEHLLRSIDVSYGNLLSPFVQLSHDENQIILPDNFNELSMRGEIAAYSGYGTVRYDRSNSSYFDQNTEVVDFTDGVNSVFYWPQGLGFFLGRSLGLTVFWCSVLARWMNLFCYSALVYFALRKMPFAKTLLAVTALLPIAVYQGASYSPDSTLNGICMLFTATCLSYAYGEKYEKEGSLNWKQGLTLGLQLAVLFLCKYVYAVLGLLVFLIPVKRFGTRKEYGKAFVIALLPVIAAVALVAGGLFSTVSGSQSADGTDLTQLQFVKANPTAFVKTLLRTVDEKIGLWIAGLATYGWMSYSLGVLVYLVPILLAVAGIFDMNSFAERLKKKDRVLLGLAFLGVFSALALGLYIGDGRINKVGALTVAGIQGRYFVPLLALPFLAFGSTKVEQKINGMGQKLLGIEAVMLVYSMVQLMEYCY